jgi:hypothetical protein
VKNFANSRWSGGRFSRYCKALLFKKFGSKPPVVLYGCETWHFTLGKQPYESVWEQGAEGGGIIGVKRESRNL